MKDFDYAQVDPYNEEDWEEYEIKKGDEIVVFFINEKYELSFLFGKTVSVNPDNNSFEVSFDKEKINNEEKNIKIKKSFSIYNELNKDKFILYDTKIENRVCIAITIKDFLYTKTNTVVTSIRKKYLNLINEHIDKINKAEKDLNNIEDKVLQVKNSYISEDNFPKSFRIKDDQYIVVLANENIDKKLDPDKGFFTLDFKICKIEHKKEKEKDKEKDTYYLVDEQGNKITYMSDTYPRLVQTGYLLIRSKKNANKRTYITNNQDMYKRFIERITLENNTNVEDIISKNRKSYNDIMDTINSMYNIKNELRTYYNNLNIRDILKTIQ